MNEIFALLLLLLLSGFFSGSETALVALSLARAESLNNGGRKGASALLELKRNQTRMLITILIGNNLVNIAAASLATVVATRWLGHLGPGVAVGVLTLLVLVFGEITPKSLATRYAERISLFVAPIILGLSRLMFPVVWIFERFTDWIHKHAGEGVDPLVTESELISMAGHGEEEGTIEPEAREMIERVFAFDDLLVEDVMTPRDKIYSLNGARTLGKALPEILNQPYSRIPLYDGHSEEIVKVLFLRDMLDAVVADNRNVSLLEIAHEVEFAPQYQPIDDLFDHLRRKKRHLAVVVDEFGVVQGIVTLEDLLEELVGEIYDESDSVPHGITRLSEHEISLSGNMELRVVENFFDIDLSGKPTDTVNYWVLEHTERIPAAGERFEIGGLSVGVERASRRRIERLTIGRKQPAAQLAAGAEPD